MTNNATHLIQHYATSKPSRSILSRANDGMVVGARNGIKVVWGEDPAAQSGRQFITEEHAAKFLRQVAEADQQQRRGKVCKYCGMPPAEMTICPSVNGGTHMIDYGESARIEEEDGEMRVLRPN